MNRSLSTICEAQMDRFAPKGTSVPGHSLLFATIILACWSWTAAQAQPIDLLERYPTTLTEGDTDPRWARAWDFSGEDIHELSQFSLDIGDRLSIRCGPSDLGIGHSTDGAVWAIVMPRTEGALISSASGAGETIDHVWLRFHPSLLGEIFPTQTVSSPGDAVKLPRMRRIASLKMRGSWHASDRAMIPFPKSLTVDVDTKDGHRRFFDADRNAGTARYVSAFTNRAVPAAVSITKSLATQSFDTLWEEGM